MIEFSIPIIIMNVHTSETRQTTGIILNVFLVP